MGASEGEGKIPYFSHFLGTLYREGVKKTNPKKELVATVCKYSMSCYLNIWPIGVHVSSDILQNLYIKRPGGIAEARSCKITKHFTGTTLNKETSINGFML